MKTCRSVATGMARRTILLVFLSFCFFDIVASQYYAGDYSCTASISLPSEFTRLKQFELHEEEEFWRDTPAVRATILPGLNSYSSGKDKDVFTSFERPLPNLLDPAYLVKYDEMLNREQVFESTCESGKPCNVFHTKGSPFVAIIKDAFVEDDSIFTNETIFVARRDGGSVKYPFFPPTPGQIENVQCYKKLITILQPYFDNYYHFVMEALPRLLIAREAMKRDPELLLLTRVKMPFISKFLSRLGIPADRIVAEMTPPRKMAFNAQELYIPRPSTIFSPPREALLALKNAIEETTYLSKPEPSKQNLVVYMSRGKKAWARSVRNEDEVLQAIRKYINTYNLNKDKSDQLSFVVFNNNISFDATLRLFRDAKIIMGPHGAGFANMLFASPSATVFEFLQSYNPILIYWHTAAALGLNYWMLPVPASHWGGDFEVPVQEVIEILHKILHPLPKRQVTPQRQDIIFTQDCPAGSIYDVFTQDCALCPPGTFQSAADGECVLCPTGRYNPYYGKTFCATCPANTYSNGPGATHCVGCPIGTVTHLLGSGFVDYCIKIEDHHDHHDGKPNNPYALMMPYHIYYPYRPYYPYYYYGGDDTNYPSNHGDDETHKTDDEDSDQDNDADHEDKAKPIITSLAFGTKVEAVVAQERSSGWLYYSMQMRPHEPILFIEIEKTEECGTGLLELYLTTAGFNELEDVAIASSIVENSISAYDVDMRFGGLKQEILFENKEFYHGIILGIHSPSTGTRCPFSIIAHSSRAPARLMSLQNELIEPNGWRFYEMENEPPSQNQVAREDSLPDFALEIVPDHSLCSIPPKVYLHPHLIVDPLTNLISSLPTDLLYSYRTDATNRIKISSLPYGQWYLSIGSNNPWPCSYSIIAELGGVDVGKPDDGDGGEEDGGQIDNQTGDNTEGGSVTPGDGTGEGDASTDNSHANTEGSGSSSSKTEKVKWAITGLALGSLLACVVIGILIVVIVRLKLVQRRRRLAPQFYENLMPTEAL